MKIFKNNSFFIAAAILAVAFFWWRYKMAPSIDFSDVNVEVSKDQEVALSSLSAQKTIIHFYATWCGPCMKELPSIVAYSESPAASGKKILFITDDSWEKIALIRPELGEKITVVRSSSLKDLGIYSIPATYFLNEDWTVEKKQLGSVDWTKEYNE